MLNPQTIGRRLISWTCLGLSISLHLAVLAMLPTPSMSLLNQETALLYVALEDQSPRRFDRQQTFSPLTEPKQSTEALRSSVTPDAQVNECAVTKRCDEVMSAASTINHPSQENPQAYEVIDATIQKPDANNVRSNQTLASNKAPASTTGHDVLLSTAETTATSSAPSPANIREDTTAAKSSDLSQQAQDPPTTSKTELEPEIDASALLARYAEDIKSAILHQKYYPPTAKRLGQQGISKIKFSIGMDGELLSADIKTSSGYAELDRAALEAIEQASPFPPLPPELKRQSISLAISLSFSLQ